MLYSEDIMLILPKLTLIITTRCNLRCKLCCEYVPQNKPFLDMTLGEERAILDALFATVDRVGTLHLSGGGEPLLHSQLAEMTELAFEYGDKFDRFMLFTNCTVEPSADLLEVIGKYKERLIIQVSRYGVKAEREAEVLSILETTGVTLKVEKYYGENQSFGGWVDFGTWNVRNRTPDELTRTFQNCAVTRDMRGNWRTRDGKVHWCSRSQRGMELGLMPDNPVDYVDLLDVTESREIKRAKFEQIANYKHLAACDRCSGEQGTSDQTKRFQAAEQIEGNYER
jgi:hypothetical protein